MGRDADRQALHDLLTAVDSSGVVAIAGMPGVGKTELAIQYGRSHLDDYRGGIAWFSAATFGEDLRDWMQSEFCPDRDLRHLPKLEQQVAFGWKEWQSFCGNRPALVIIDDVTDYRQQVEPYLPQTLSEDLPFRFVLTSRSHLISSTPIPTLDLRELKPDAAVAMLARFAGTERIDADRPTAETLCHRLAYLPLAIALAGCWLNSDIDANHTLTDLMTTLEQEGLDAPALDRDPQTVRLTAERGLNAAFAVSWKQLAETNPSAQQLARVLTVFAPVDLPWELVLAVIQTYDQLHPQSAQSAAPIQSNSSPGWWTTIQQFWQTLWQRLQRWLGYRPPIRPIPATAPIPDPLEARGTLRRMSLLERVDGDEQLYRLHPLLREFFAAQWAGADQEGWHIAFAWAIGERAQRVPKELSWEQAATFDDLRPHLSAADKVLKERATETADPDTKERYRSQAREIRAAKFRLAQPVLFETAFERARKTHEEAKAALAHGNRMLAQQKFTEAIQDYRRVIDQARATFPADSLQLAGYLNRIATLFRELGRYQDGIPPAEEAVRIATDRVHPVKLASYLNDLASLQHDQGNYSEAEPLYGRSLAIAEQQLGADHPNVAYSLNNLAELYRAMGRYGEAEPLFGRSLAIWEQQLGADHPNVAASLNNLAAGLYHAMGRYSEAEPLLERSLAIWEQQLGADHPDVAASLNNLANLYNVMGRYSEAEPLYRRSLAIAEQQLGADHPDVATSLNNLAGLYHAMGRYSEAEPLFGRSLAIMEQQLGADHPNVASSLNNLAGLYEAMGRYSEAEPLYLRALDIQSRTLPENHPWNKTGWSNFRGMVQAALAAGQADQLSDHPTTQAMLQQLRENT